MALIEATSLKLMQGFFLLRQDVAPDMESN